MLLFKKKYKYIFLIIPLVLLYRYDLVLFGDSTEESVGECFLSHLFGGSYRMEHLNLSISILGLLGIIFLSLLFADYIVHDISENTEYIFSRYSNRKIWYREKLLGTFGYCNLGIFLYILFYIFRAVQESQCGITQKDILLILCTYIMLVLFSYFSIVCINLLVFYYGISIGFVLYYSALIISSITAYIIQKFPHTTTTGVLHRINPMSNIFVSWNFNSSYILWGMGYYFVICVLVSYVLWRKIKKHEIGINVRTET